jgi:hypothetical protein
LVLCAVVFSAGVPPPPRDLVLEVEGFAESVFFAGAFFTAPVRRATTVFLTGTAFLVPLLAPGIAVTFFAAPGRRVVTVLLVASVFFESDLLAGAEPDVFFGGLTGRAHPEVDTHY